MNDWNRSWALRCKTSNAAKFRKKLKKQASKATRNAWKKELHTHGLDGNMQIRVKANPWNVI